MFIRRLRVAIEDKDVSFKTAVVAYPEDTKVMENLAHHWEKGTSDLVMNGG